MVSCIFWRVPETSRGKNIKHLAAVDLGISYESVIVVAVVGGYSCITRSFALVSDLFAFSTR